MLYLIRLRGREREMALRIVNGSTVGGLMVMFLVEVSIVLLVAMAFGMLGIDWGYGFDDVPGMKDANKSQFHFSIGGSID